MAQRDVQASHRAIVAYVMTRAHRDRGGSWVSHETVAEVMGCKLRTVGTAMAEAIQRGYVGRQRRKHDSNIYWPAMPPEYRGEWPKTTPQDPQPIADLEGQDPQPSADQGSQDRHPIAEGDRQPIADNAPQRNPLSDDAAAPASSSADWPAGGVAEQAQLLCELMGVPLTPALVDSAPRWFSTWARQGLPWVVVLAGGITTAMRNTAFDSFGYLDREIQTAHRKAAENPESFDPAYLVHCTASERGVALEPAA